MTKNRDYYLIYIGIGILLLGLGIFAYLGIFNRYYADDWCYNKDLQRLGVVGALEGYNYIGTYASNRYALTLFSGLIFSLDILGIQIMTPLTIFLWLGGIIWLLQVINKINGQPFKSAVIILLSGVILFFSIRLAPHIYQNLYWRSGLLPYTAPLVFTPYIFALVFQKVRSGKQRFWDHALVAILALFVGGFSEIASTFLVAAAGICFILSRYGIWKKRDWAIKTQNIAVTALVFAILALVLEIASPANAARQAHSYGDPTSLANLPGKVLIYTYYFTRVTTSKHALAFVVIFGLSFCTAYITTSKDDHQVVNFRQAIMASILIGITTFLLVAASLTPSLYIQGSLPTIRAEIIPIFTLISACVGMAAILGIATPSILRAKGFEIAAIIGYCLAFVFIARTIPAILDNVAIYATRAEIWDVRDEYVRFTANEGIDLIEVSGIDGAPIGGLHDIKANPKHWVNRCAANYYGVKAIQATQ